MPRDVLTYVDTSTRMRETFPGGGITVIRHLLVARRGTLRRGASERCRRPGRNPPQIRCTSGKGRHARVPRSPDGKINRIVLANRVCRAVSVSLSRFLAFLRFALPHVEYYRSRGGDRVETRSEEPGRRNGMENIVFPVKEAYPPQRWRHHRSALRNE